MRKNRNYIMKCFLVSNIFKHFIRVLSNRKNGLKKEVEFWDNWLETSGGDWKDDFHRRICPDSLVSRWHSSIIDGLHSGTVDILDVGAGPITSFGFRHLSKKLQIWAVDPLADDYMEMLARYGIDPVVETRKCSGEELERVFDHSRFDMVNARNCLDHSVDPIQCIRSMRNVCKVGGYITLIHAENEAIQNNYLGLHKWNFCLKGNRLWIQGDLYESCVDDEFAGMIEWVHECDNGTICSAGKRTF